MKKYLGSLIFTLLFSIPALAAPQTIKPSQLSCQLYHVGEYNFLPSLAGVYRVKVTVSDTKSKLLQSWDYRLCDQGESPGINCRIDCSKFADAILKIASTHNGNVIVDNDSMEILQNRGHSLGMVLEQIEEDTSGAEGI